MIEGSCRVEDVSSANTASLGVGCSWVVAHSTRGGTRLSVRRRVRMVGVGTIGVAIGAFGDGL